MKENLFLKLSIFCFLFIGLSSLNSKLYSGNYVVSGAGLTEVNGTYVETGTCNGGFPRYVFVNGSNTFVIISDGYNWYIDEESGSCSINDFSVKYQISSTASLPPASGWLPGSYGGSYPVPSVASQTSTINITSFSPSSGPVGTLVTITGTDLSSPTAFTIGGVPAIVVSNDGTTLVGMVMPGATTGAISLTTGGGNAISSGNFMVIATPYPNTQQGNKLVGTGNTGSPYHGNSVAISADGNTAIVGASKDDADKGAAWIYTRSGSIWSQQGDKLVGTGAVGAAKQGMSVSLSADGNTAIVGGFADNTNKGAVWIFTRSANIWAQQGSKLVGTGAHATGSAARQGISVSLSADGNTAAVGGDGDYTYRGAIWVFIRTGNSWTQQGAKLVVPGVASATYLGYSIALSPDGNTLITGGRGENSGEGAAWIFTRSGSSWSLQGSKLVGTGGTSGANQGSSVDLSADGNTAIVGGWYNNAYQGAAWVFTRSTGTWSQQAILVGTGNTGNPYQGESVALSADGNTALVGGSYDNANVGATWVYTRSGSTWSQQGSKLVGTGGGPTIQQGKAAALSADGYTAIIGGPNDSYGKGAVWIFAPAPPCANPTDGGEIGSNQTICNNSAPAPLTQTVVPGGTPSGTLQYKWQQSSNGADFSDITPLVETTGFAPPALTANTWYKRLIKVDCKTDWTDAEESNAVKITIEPTPVSGTLTKSPDVANVCEETDVSATFAAGSGGNGTDVLEYRTHNGTVWSGWATYTSGNDISTSDKTQVEIQTIRQADYCNDATANTVSWIIDPTTRPGGISGSSSITYGSSTGDLTLTNNVGSILKWQKRLGTSGGWTDIANTTAIYSETPTSVGNWQYSVQVQSGTCDDEYAEPHDITVEPKELTIGGSFTANDKIYDDNTDASFDANTLELSGVVGTDDVYLTGLEIDFASKTTGEHTVTITSASLAGADKDNYTLTLTGSPETTATINAGPPVKFLVTNPEGGEIISPKLQNIPFDVKVTLVDGYDNPTPNTGGNVTITLTGSGGGTPGDLRFQGFPANPVTQTLNAGDTISNFANVLYTGVSAVAGFDVKVSASASGTGIANGKTGESNLFSVRDIFFNVLASPTSIIANGSSTSNLTVTLEDHDNNPLANQTITVETDKGTLLDGLTEIVGTGTFITDGNGQVLLNLRSETTVGTATVTAKCPGACPATATVEFVPGRAAKLVFTTQPSATTQAGATFAQQPEIIIQDAFGNTVTAATDNVTVDLTTGTGTLSGTKTVSAVSGVATFTNLSIDLTGNNKVLTATSGSLAAATTSPAFAITSAVAASLAVTGQNSLPAGTQSGNFTITVYDAYNNPTNVSQTTVLTLSTTSTGSGVLFTPIQVTVPANSSTATFKYSDNQLTFPGQYATLTATFNSGDPALTGKSATKQLEVTAGLWQIANTSPAAAGNTQFYPGANWQQDVFQPSATGQSTTTNDVMHYVYQPLTGNGTIIARLDDVQNNGWAGVMMRESNAPGAKTILFKTRLYNPNVYVGYRATTGKSMTNISKVYQLIRWMKIQRNGNTFQVFVSYNGTSWTRSYTSTIAMNNTINAGIFTESSSASRTSKAWFDNVELSNTLKSGDEFSEMEIVNLDTTQVDVQIYPNPAKDVVNLNLTGFENLSGLEATLISAEGKTMKTFIISELQTQLNIQGMKPGVYILRIENADNVVVKRLVIQ